MAIDGGHQHRKYESKMKVNYWSLAYRQEWEKLLSQFFTEIW